MRLLATLFLLLVAIASADIIVKTDRDHDRDHKKEKRRDWCHDMEDACRRCHRECRPHHLRP
jgi:hypothetical protein